MDSKRVAVITARQVAGMAVGLYLNKKLDGYLASRPNPGKINRGYRKLLAFSRRPAVIVANVACGVLATIAIECQMEELLNSLGKGQYAPIPHPLSGVFYGVCSICQQSGIELIYEGDMTVLKEHEAFGKHCCGSYDFPETTYVQR